MFFEVKIFDSRGDLQKVVSPKKLSRRFWKEDSIGVGEYVDGSFVKDDWGDSAEKELGLKMEDKELG